MVTYSNDNRLVSWSGFSDMDSKTMTTSDKSQDDIRQQAAGIAATYLMACTNDCVALTNDIMQLITANNARASAEARQQEHEWLFSKFGDTDASTRDWELIYNEAQARLNSLDRPTATGTEESKQ